MGPSGAGKSTLARLLLGMHLPSSGTITFDGQDLRDLDLQKVRDQMGVVLQETFLFDDTVRTNLGLKDEEIPLERLRAAAKVACVDHVIDAMPDGFNSRLGDNGNVLSGGQRQRLNLARALVKDPAMLLLDEATSALDLETERQVHASLAGLGCTRILIAHRLATVQDADRILVLEAGRLSRRARTRSSPRAMASFDRSSKPRSSPPMPSAAAASETALQVRTTTPPLPDLPVRGFDAVEAVWRMLRRHGHEGGLQAFREAHDLRGSAEALAEPLERAGIEARPAIVTADELVYLDVPTLLQLRDGAWVVLADRRRDRLQLEGSSGPCSITAAEVGPFLSGYVLDVSPSLPAGKGLFGRLRALVLHHRRTLALLAMASLLMQLLALVGPEITSVVMNTALPDRARLTLHVVAAGVLLVAAFQACIGWFRDRVLLFLVTRMEVSAERGVLQHLLRLPFPLLDKMTVGERLQAINGVSGARELVAERSLAAVLDGVMAVTFVVAMAAKMPAATLFVVIVATVMAGLSVLAGSAQARHQAREIEAQTRERGLLSEIVAGIGTIESCRGGAAGAPALAAALQGGTLPCAEAPATRPVERRVPRDVPAGAVRGAARLGRGADAARRAARRDPPRVRPAQQRVSRRGLRARPRPRRPSPSSGHSSPRRRRS